jgi:hypothetical protein
MTGTTKTARAAMKHDHTPRLRIASRTPRLACAAAVAAVLMTAIPQAADSDHVNPPAVPPNIQAPAGSRAFLLAHAVGTQNYICLPAATGGFAWTLFGPQATLFDDELDQVLTHFLSPNPVENGLGRATWQHSRDTSSVWAQAIQTSSDPGFVAPGAIPWLLLRVVGVREGPTGGDKLAAATYIQRVNTVAGVAPSAGCPEPGMRTLVPYEADYVFYRSGARHPHDRD